MSLINKLQSSFSAGEISPRLRGRVDVDKYASSCRELLNYIVLPFGAVTHRSGFKFVKALADSTKLGRLVPFQYSNSDSYVLEFSNGKIRFYRNQGIILDSRTFGNPIYTVTIPYTDSELADLRFDQSFDTLYICHSGYAPRKLVRSDHDLWTLSTITFAEPAFLDINATAVTLTPSGTTGSVTFTASSATFASTDVGRAIRYKAGEDNTDTVQYTGTGSQTYFDITFYPQTSSDVDVYLIGATGQPTLLTYDATPSAGEYNVTGGQINTGFTPTTSEKIQIKRKNAGSGIWGYATITAYTSSTQVTATVNSTLGGTNASVYWRLGAWSATTGYPKLCTFHEQRLWFANTTSQPRNIWGSGTGDFENFSPDNADKKGQVDADTAVSFELNTPAIQWIKGLKAMIVGCSDGIIQISNPSGAISASTVRTKKDSSLPVAFQEVATTADEIIFTELLGRKLYSIKYSFESDGFQTTELTTLSEHMSTGSAFASIVYTDTPNRVVWVRRANGSLRSCTYVPSQNLVGWAQHQVGGTDVVIESITAIAGTTYTELWALVSRTINGTTKKYVEVMQKDFDGDAIEDAFFVDSGLTYDGSPTTSISGLTHLEGQTVTVIVDGATHPNEVVSGGAITLDLEGSVVQVGLYSEARLESQFIEGGSQIGTNQASISSITSVAVRFHETVGGELGFDSANTTIIPFRTPSTLMNEAVELFSGDKLITFNHGNDLGYKVFLKQPYALPSTILALVYKARVSNR